MSERRPVDLVQRAMTEDDAFRVVTLRATDTVRTAVACQELAGEAATQLGEVLAAAVLVRETMAPPYRVQVIRRDVAGEMVLGDAFPEGRTRALARVADSVLGLQLGRGDSLEVMRSLPGRAPHQGIVDLGEGDRIASALERYFAQSEQIATMVGLACVVRGDEVVAAGGFVAQQLPEVHEPPIEAMRARLAALGDLGPALVAHDADPQWLMDQILASVPYAAVAHSAVEFSCHCDRSKAVGAVAALGVDDLRDMLRTGEVVKVKCDYCRTEYQAGPEDVRRILEGSP